MYAHDVVIIINSIQKMQALLGIWINEILKMEMEVNTSKNKVMIINEKRERQNNRDIKCKGETLLFANKTSTQ